MAGRIMLLLTVVLLAIAAAPGCASLGPRNADLSRFQVADSLTLTHVLSDDGSLSFQNSVTFSDERKVDEVYILLHSLAANWKPVPATPAAPQFRLDSFKNGKVTDTIGLIAPAGESGKVVVQMKMAGAGMYYKDISEQDFERLLVLFGVPRWLEGPDSQHADGR